MDNNYQTYVNKTAQLTLPKNYLQQLKNIQNSAKFREGKAIYFPGFSVITPPGNDDSYNNEFYSQLKEFQAQIAQNLDSNLFIPIPPSSFHLTVADLIWEQDYEKSVKKNPNFDSLLIQEINAIFEEYKRGLTNSNPLQFELLGLSIFPRAITICLVPSEKDYQEILTLRKYIYQNANIIKLGIEQHYDFNAHITLGYFDQIIPNLDLENIQNTLTSINDEWLEKNPPNFFINQIELRKFDDMTIYNPVPNCTTINYQL
jgi:hypothetical protein